MGPSWTKYGIHPGYQAAVFVYVGDVRSTYFWEDRWLHGMRIQEIAPLIYDRIRPSIRNARTVVEALGGIWPTDVGPDLGVDDIRDYLVLWEHIFGVELHADIANVLWWAFEPSGNFLVISAYASRFFGCHHDLTATII